MQRAAAGLAGSADHSRIEGEAKKSEPPRKRRPLNGGRQPASTCIAKRPIARGIGRHGSGARALSQHVADVGGAGRIGEHGGAKIGRGEAVADCQTENVDYLVGVRPHEMRAEDEVRVLVDQQLMAVDRLGEAAGGEPVWRRGCVDPERDAAAARRLL